VETTPPQEDTDIPKKSETSVVPPAKAKEEIRIPENISKENIHIPTESVNSKLPTETQEPNTATVSPTPELPTKKHHPQNGHDYFLADNKTEKTPKNYIPEKDTLGISVATDDGCHVLSRELEIPALRILSLRSSSRIEWDTLPKAQAYHVYKKDAL